MHRKKKPCKVHFFKDSANEECLIKDKLLAIMMPWQKPYMQACIEALKPEGDVLEVGFGCGYAATFIQEHHPRSHTIIEYHPIVANKARQWAKAYHNITIIEDTWQNALGKLGVFDTIFFDDTPLESALDAKACQEIESLASLALKQGKKLITKLKQKFPFLKHMKYRDQDLDYFFKNLQNKKSIDPNHFLPFFQGLRKKGSITERQWEAVLARLLKERLITHQILAEFKGKLHEVDFRPSKEAEVDRFFEFLQICLKKHMKEGSRCSYSVDTPTSKFEEERFFNEIILNPYVDFKEHLIPIEVPENCYSYPYDQALVVIMTKR
ncbi:MAG: class I SAM-dependent methyltransferase [Chlamydiota bacterium]